MKTVFTIRKQDGLLYIEPAPCAHSSPACGIVRRIGWLLRLLLG